MTVERIRDPGSTTGLEVMYRDGGPQPLQTLPILEGDQWRYFKGTEEPPSDWKEIGFDDSVWLSGPSGFGYGDSDDMTVLSDMQDNYISVYLRKEFTVADPNAVARTSISPWITTTVLSLT